MKNYIQPGATVSVPAPYDVKSGQGALVGSLFGVAAYDALAGAPVEILTEGVFAIDKTSAQAWTVGAPIYWDAATRLATSTVGSNVKIGHAIEAAANPSATCAVRLSV